jgi:hypothetical protein
VGFLNDRYTAVLLSPSGTLSTFVRARQSGKWGQDSKLRPLPAELLIVGDHEVSPVVNDSVGDCTGNCSLAGVKSTVRSTSWMHRSIPSRPNCCAPRGWGCHAGRLTLVADTLRRRRTELVPRRLHDAGDLAVVRQVAVPGELAPGRYQSRSGAP